MQILYKERTNLNQFCTGCPKSSVKGGNTIFLEKKNIRPSAAKKIGKMYPTSFNLFTVHNNLTYILGSWHGKCNVIKKMKSLLHIYLN